MLTMGWLPHRLSKHSQSYSGLHSPRWSYSTYLCHNHFVIIIFLTFLFKVKIYQVISVQIVVVDDDDDDDLSSFNNDNNNNNNNFIERINLMSCR